MQVCGDRAGRRVGRHGWIGIAENDRQVNRIFVPFVFVFFR
jgi:hypothetical protein